LPEQTNPHMRWISGLATCMDRLSELARAGVEYVDDDALRRRKWSYSGQWRVHHGRHRPSMQTHIGGNRTPHSQTPHPCRAGPVTGTTSSCDLPRIPRTIWTGAPSRPRGAGMIQVVAAHPALELGSRFLIKDDRRCGERHSRPASLTAAKLHRCHQCGPTSREQGSWRRGVARSDVNDRPPLRRVTRTPG
jgi:hypothetical protein